MKLTFNIPVGVVGDFSISTDGEHTVLHKSGIDNIMQDTEKEYEEHKSLWENATGNVLIGGLGIGFVNQFLIDNPKVTSVTIIEKHQEVIDLVWKHCPKDDTFTLIHDDIESWKPTKHFDVAWFDTWLTDNSMNKKEYNKFMTEKYSPHCKWIGFWEKLKGLHYAKLLQTTRRCHCT